MFPSLPPGNVVIARSWPLLDCSRESCIPTLSPRQQYGFNRLVENGVHVRLAYLLVDTLQEGQREASEPHQAEVGRR